MPQEDRSSDFQHGREPIESNVRFAFLLTGHEPILGARRELLQGTERGARRSYAGSFCRHLLQLHVDSAWRRLELILKSSDQASA